MAELQGYRLDARTKDMIERLIWKTGLDLRISQGSYSTSVSASGGTHAGGGAVDLSVRSLSLSEQEKVVLVGRQIGFAIWIRQAISGVWPKHIHGVAIDCPDLSNAAERQVQAYYDGRNGLANNGPDDGPDGYRQNTWERWNAAHSDEELLMATGDEILAELKSVKSTLASFTQTEAGRYDVDSDRYKDLRGLISAAVAEARTAEDEGVAGPRYSALQDSVNALAGAVAALTTKVDALPKA